MSAKKYTHLFFDLDNTIWDFNSNSFEALRIALDKLGLLKSIGSYETFYAIYSEENDRVWELYRNNLITKKVLRAERFEASFRRNRTPLDFIGGEVINDSYLEAMTDQTKLIEGATKVLDYLYNKYKIAIITNGFKEVQYDKISKSNLSGYFSKVFVSEEIGSPKPDKKIFEHALKSMNAPKKSTLMIGDSWEADIKGAINIGIDQIYFNPEMQQFEREGTIAKNKTHEKDTFLKYTPSFSALEPINIHNKKVQTTVITHLEQLLIIL